MTLQITELRNWDACAAAQMWWCGLAPHFLRSGHPRGFPPLTRQQYSPP